MVKIITGDLMGSSAKYICHQVNCQGVMGSGVAKQIKAKWPDVYERYEKLSGEHKDNKEWLLGKAQRLSVGEGKYVVNLFGQLEYGRDGKVYTDIEALRNACKAVASHVAVGDTIAMPYRIGCGLGGGDWGVVMDMLCEVFGEHHLTLYKK